MLKPRKLQRDEELSTRASVEREALKTYKDVEKGFQDQRQRSDDGLDYWDAYNCKLSDRQFYAGNAKIFVPIIPNAVKARKTRFVNQMFPQSGRYVEATTPDGDHPSALIALLDHYVKKARLRTQVMPALSVAGDIEGQYSLYVSWREIERHQVWRKKKPVVPAGEDGLEFPEAGTVETVEEEKVKFGHPTVEVIPDADLLVLPATVDDIDEALDIGGSVTVIRRWTQAKIKKQIRDGAIRKEPGEALIKAMSKREGQPQRDTKKELADAAGIKSGSNGKFAMVYETWMRMKVDGEHRLVRCYFGGEKQLLGCKRSPYWNDRAPIISAPVEKIGGVFKGRSRIADVIDMQVFANDAVNEAADTAHFSAMPIVMTDPEKNPKTGTMVLGLAAVWETNPNDTKFAQFPELWKHGFELVKECKGAVYETLGVNPSMIPQSTGGKSKRNQAEIALEQQVDLLTTADAVTIMEEGILSPLLQWFADLDYQFRDDEMMVRVFGDMGERAKMETIPPLEMDGRYSFRWFGVEAARNAAQVQQQIAMANVFKSVPPQMYAGFRLNMAPLMVQLAENAFGPRLGPLIFEDIRKQITVDPEEENLMLHEGFLVNVHPGDDDMEHIRSHIALLQEDVGDPHGTIRTHIQAHQAAYKQKADAAAQAQQVGQGQGGPGGGGGAPAPGAQPGTARGVKGPPGMIHADQMAGAGAPQVQQRAMG